MKGNRKGENGVVFILKEVTEGKVARQNFGHTPHQEGSGGPPTDSRENAKKQSKRKNRPGGTEKSLGKDARIKYAGRKSIGTKRTVGRRRTRPLQNGRRCLQQNALANPPNLYISG